MSVAIIAPSSVVNSTSLDKMSGSVDIIVPCYHYGRYLRECVTSVLSQSVNSLRVLIINDASPDNTREVAAELSQEDSRVSYIEHASNKGHIFTYNEGIEWASADYLLLLSADDYLLPAALQRAVALMGRHPEVGLTFGNAIEIDEQGGRWLTNRVKTNDEECVLAGAKFIALSGSRNLVPTPTAVVRTVLQKKVKGYRKELPHAGDMELWLRLAAHAAVGFIRSPQAVYRRHTRNMSLSYAADCYLPDIAQRKAALDCFLESCSNVVSNSTRVRTLLFYSLALDAVGLASAAFNRGQLKQMNQLAEYALRTSPNVNRSWAWVKLAFKRQMGVKAWQRLRPPVQFVRRPFI